MTALLPYLLGGAVLVVMVVWATFDAAWQKNLRDTERQRLKRSITDLECWIEIADRKSAAEADRELKQRERSVITDEPGQIIHVGNEAPSMYRGL